MRLTEVALRVPKRDTLQNAVALLLSVVICLAVAEVFLRTTAPPQRYLDERTDSYWRALRSVSPRALSEEGDLALHPELGWRMKPYFERDGVHHNSLGFRGKREYAPNRRGPRVLAIGDSFTYGLGVADESTFSAILERIAGIEVLNAGVNGYGVDQASLMWEIEGRRFHPSSVILGYYVDDFFRNELSLRDGPKPRFVYDPATQRYRLEQLAGRNTAASEASSQSILEGSLKIPQAMGWVVRRARSRFCWLEVEGLTRRARLSEYLLRRLHSSVTQSGARLLVVVIGHSYDGLPEHLWIEQSIVQACRANGIECLNLAAARREAGSTPLYGENGHFSEQGHRFVAERIAETLGLGH